ncbi:MAG: hypothetical protein AAGM67_00435, partial [Bacteroidota bacterium]
FKTTNIGANDPQWQPINDLFENLAISAIVQDPTNANTMYFSTGEGWFNIDAMQGLGIWKSDDGGANWAQLASTANNAFFRYTQDMKIDANGVVFAATQGGGLQRSTDGGTSWTRVLGSGLSGATNNSAADIEIASNGDMYCTLGVQSAGGIYRSTNGGLSWTELTSGLPSSNFERIELAVAPCVI